jgi:broad specificity phosphatase PhoE
MNLMALNSTLSSIGSLALLVAGVSATAAGLSTAELRERASAQRCEQPRPGHVVYTGDSDKLAECLKSLEVNDIAELRINSRGGEIPPTLQLGESLIGKIDLLIVDGLCASSCANYILPTARRLIVEPDSLVVLHGSIDVRQIAAYLEANRERFMAQAAGMTSEQMDEEFKRVLAEFEDQAKHQAAFAEQRLSCSDWLDPNLHFRAADLPNGFKYMIVTHAMAKRCLKETKVERFWAPPTDDESLARFREEGLLPANH